MGLIYLLSGLAFDSLVIMFAFLFGAIPGGWYKRKLPQLLEELRNRKKKENIMNKLSTRRTKEG